MKEGNKVHHLENVTIQISIERRKKLLIGIFHFARLIQFIRKIILKVLNFLFKKTWLKICISFIEKSD